MVRIRLQRIGKRNRPYFRIAAMDARTPRNGKVLEILGTYDPLKEGENIELKEDRVRHWLSHGAQPTDKVAVILKKRGILEER